MRNIKLTIAYDGTCYHGFQKQINAITVQEKLEEALNRILNTNIRIHFAGRTDTGVHALQQVINFYTDRDIAPMKLLKALNTCLPRDIIVKEAEEKPHGFHARKSAIKKIYRYTFDLGKTPDIFWRLYAWHPIYKLDLDKMKQAGSYLVGTHDFSAFRAKGSTVETSVRTIFHLSWDESRTPIVHLYLEANGFLYKMARIIVGTLVEVGRGRIEPEDVQQMLLEADPKMSGPTAPAKGLLLWGVEY